MNFAEINPLPVTCRQSTITCAISCERKWFCQYRLGIGLRGVEIKEAATLGTIYHHLQSEGPGGEKIVQAWVREKQKELMAIEDPDGQAARFANMLTGLYHKAEAMARLMWERFPQPENFKVIGKEIEHSMEWNGLVLNGTIDYLLQQDGGGIWIRDHKTTGRSLAALFGGLSWSIQGRLYRVLANDYCTAISLSSGTRVPSIRGFILDGILKPGIKLCKKDMTNAKEWKVTEEDAYLRRVKEWYQNCGEETMRSKGIMFTEPLFPEELTNALGMMRGLSMRPIHPSHYRRDVTRTACFAYEKQCVFHDLCETDPNQWDELFERKYKLVGREAAKTNNKK